jgi:hypothetical protein
MVGMREHRDKSFRAHPEIRLLQPAAERIPLN